MGENDKREAEDDKDRAGDLIDDGQCAQGELVSQLAGHHDLSHVCGHIYQKTNGENDDPFLECVVHREDGGITQPEEDDAGIEGIDDKS